MRRLSTYLLLCLALSALQPAAAQQRERKLQKVFEQAAKSDSFQKIKRIDSLRTQAVAESLQAEGYELQRQWHEERHSRTNWKELTSLLLLAAALLLLNSYLWWKVFKRRR
jgi:Flp pilus assembly protein TadB